MSRDCERWEGRLDAYLADELSDGERRDFLDHADACERCATLLALVADDLPELAASDAPDLISPVMAVTSGPACARAEALLGRRPDGDLTEREAVLLEGHLDGCGACSALAEALAAALPTLRELAAPPLDERFTYDVLRATRTSRSRKRAGAMSRLADRLGAWWGLQIERPRFAWEAAFVATVVAALLFAMPFSPARRAPARALAAVQASPAWMVDTAGRALAAAGDLLATIGDDLATRRSRTSPDRADLRRHGRQLGDALLHADPGAAGASLKAVAVDVDRMWDTWRAAAPDTLR